MQHADLDTMIHFRCSNILLYILVNLKVKLAHLHNKIIITRKIKKANEAKAEKFSYFSFTALYSLIIIIQINKLNLRS